MKFKFLILFLSVSNISLALEEPNLASALIAEFYIQNDEPDEAYLSYQEIIDYNSSEATAIRALQIADLTENQQWQQDSMAELLKFQPENLTVATQYLLSLINPEQFQKATSYSKKYFQLLQNKFKVDSRYYKKLAVSLSKSKDKKLATDLMAMFYDKSNIASVNAMAIFHYFNQQYLMAKKYAQISLQIDPNFENTIIIFADTLYSKNEKQNAANFLRYKAKQTNSSKLFNVLGQLFLKEKQYKKAELVYLDLLKIDPENSLKWHRTLSTAYILLNKYEDAHQHLLKLTASKKYQSHAYYSLALLYTKQNYINLAKNSLKQIQPGKYYFKAQRLLAELLAKDDQKTALKIVNSLSVNNLDGYLDLIETKIKIHEIHQEWQKSYDLHSSAISLKPNIKFYYSRAILAEKMNKIDLMEQDFLFIINQQKNNYEALNALGYSLVLNTTRYDEAKQYIERALKIRPNSFYILDSMGWVLHKQGKNKQAIKFLKQALAIKVDADIAAHLAIVYAKTGNKIESDRYLLQAMLLNKDNPTVIDAISVLKTKNSEN